jgi:xanthine/uracil permease
MLASLPSDRLRRIFLAAVTTVSLALIPWIGYLAASLPDRYVAGQWKAAWVGFDIVLVAGLAATAWSAWRRRELLVPAAIITATLLICDAWFDVLLDWGTPDMLWSVATAALVELPLAALLLWVAVRLLRLMQRVRWNELGHDGDLPPLWRTPLRELLSSEQS